MDKYAVLGNPISQSKSPLIHSLFAKQFGERLQYEALCLPKDQFSAEVTQLFSRKSFKGANVTVPFKQDAAKFAMVLNDNARTAGAVNTLIKQDNGIIIGANTDGIGLVQDLLLNGVTLTGKSVLMVGAGGAARGVINPLLMAGVSTLCIVNRTPTNAYALVDHFSDHRVSASEFADINAGEPGYDIIINSTSASLSHELPPLSDAVIAGAQCCYDMAYLSQPTVFVQRSQALGVKQSYDGLGMLVGQAAESFYLWRGVRPDPKPVLELLRRQLEEDASAR